MISDKLKPYQREAAERIARNRSMLLADQPGLGKTYTSLGALELSGAVGPSSETAVGGRRRGGRCLLRGCVSERLDPAEGRAGGVGRVLQSGER